MLRAPWGARGTRRDWRRRRSRNGDGRANAISARHIADWGVPYSRFRAPAQWRQRRELFDMAPTVRRQCQRFVLSRERAEDAPERSGTRDGCVGLHPRRSVVAPREQGPADAGSRFDIGKERADSLSRVGRIGGDSIVDVEARCSSPAQGDRLGRSVGSQWALTRCVRAARSAPGWRREAAAPQGAARRVLEGAHRPHRRRRFAARRADRCRPRVPAQH